MCHSVIKFVVVWTHLCTLVYVQGNRFKLNNENLIYINSRTFHNFELVIDDVDLNLKFSDNDIVLNDYFKNCDDSIFGYSSTNVFDNGSVADYPSVYGFSFPLSGCICCTATTCLCDSIQNAVHHTRNNTVIVMTNSAVSMGSFVSNSRTIAITTFENLTNLSLIGYNDATIDCNFLRSIHFKYCNNVTIENIMWIRCGSDINDRPQLADAPAHLNHVNHRFFYYYNYGIKFNSNTNVYLKNCTFVASKVGIFAISGVVHIDQVTFLSNAYNIISYNRDAATLLTIINQADMITNNVTVKITNSLFTTMGDNGLLLFYIFADNRHPGVNFNIIIKHTNFTYLSCDPSSVTENVVWIRLSSNVNITLNTVKITSNNFTQAYNGLNVATILSIDTDLSTVRDQYNLSIVKIESCSFLNNIANKILHLKGDMHLDIIDTNFSNNNVNSILFITSSHDATAPRNKIVQILQSAFLNNNGGHLMSLNGTYVVVKMSKLHIINNTLSSEYNSLLLFHNYTTLVASFSEMKYEHNNITGESSGFYFVPRRIISAEIIFFFFYDYHTLCIPSEFQIIEFGDCFITNPMHWILFANSSFSNNTGGGHGSAIYLNLNLPQYKYANTISTCIFDNNSGYRSLIYSSSYDGTVQLTVKDSVFTNNKETVFYISNQVLQFSNEKELTVFENNRAQNGAALYLHSDSKVQFNDSSLVSFSKNVARRYGGAIYYDITQSSRACRNSTSVFVVPKNITSLDFKNNLAGLAGNSMYFSVSQSCDHIIQYDEYIFNQIAEVSTSPNQLKLYFPAQLTNKTDSNVYYISDVMLGQNIIIPACVLDQHEMPAGPVQFTIQIFVNSDQNYSFQGNALISVICDTLQGINNLFITGRPPNINSTITIQLTSLYDSTVDWKPITVNLNVQLSSCHSGFYYNGDLERCVCYTTDDIVMCSDSNSSIRIGYWFGTINNQPTVTACPSGYCNFESCQAVSGTCDLYPLRDNQCRSHRSGAACGSCAEGYTLSFDSDCVSIDNCTIGQTVLVIMMSVLFWIISIVVVFTVMYLKVEIGYLYGITFYYSTIDILFGETSLLTENVHQFVVILSSVAKLIPQFLGQFCLIKGLSGIDQQFIHYLHPLAVLLLLSLISFSTRFSRRLSIFVSRAVIHAICLLLLLSYTSIASTSLLLMRPIRFVNVDEVYSYLSPDIKYFHGRHLIYVLIAAFVGLVIMIGLPLLLSLEPFINYKINFIRIKPFLDQFQGCYKDKFRYFASYYMIFRLIILTVVVINPTNIFITLYSLFVLCSFLTFIHIAVRPYANPLLNLFDSFMLFTLMLVIPLLIVETYHGLSSNATFVIAILLIIAPLIGYLLMVVYLQLDNIKKFVTRCTHFMKPSKTEVTANSETIEMHQCEHEVIVDQRLRDKCTTTVCISMDDNDCANFRDSLLELSTT